MKKLCTKYREIILYIIFGGATTLINIIAYYICSHPLKMEVVPSTAIAWGISVLFAYLSNKWWVFQSTEATLKVILRELISFIFSRVFTGVLDIVLMFWMVDLLHWKDMPVKVGVNIIVILLNYAASKLIVFKQRK